MFGNLLYLSVVLQETPRNVERNIGTIDDAVQKHEELGDHFLNVIRDEYLIAIKFHLSLFELYLLFFHLREI